MHSDSGSSHGTASDGAQVFKVLFELPTAHREDQEQEDNPKIYQNRSSGNNAKFAEISK